MNEFIIHKKKRNKYVPLTLRLEENLYNKSKDIVLKNDLKSVNQFLNDCIRFAIENLEVDNQ